MATLESTLDELGVHVEERELVGLTDAELADRLYELVGALNEDISDGFYRLLGEVFERFAPEAELADYDKRLQDDPNIETELDATIGAMRRRWEARLRLSRER